MTNYPATLPCVSRIEGHSAAIAAGLVRTPMESGNSRQRRIFRTLPHQISLVFMVEQAQFALWLSWVNAHAWDDWIAVKLPGLHASINGANALATPVRFMSDLATELQPVEGLWLWKVSVSAEYQPVPTDLLALDGFWYIGGTPAAPAGAWVLGGTPAAPAPIFVNPGTLTAPVTIV